jgi:hypothetical protein
MTHLARSVRVFIDAAPAKMEWLVDSLLPAHGLLLVVAPQRTGKTMLLLDLVTAVASGAPFLGQPTQRGRTLYVMLEGPAASLAERYRRLAAHRSLDDCYVVHGHDVRAQSEAWEQLLADVELLRPALVVVDTYARVLPIGADENSARDVGITTAALDRLVRLGAAVVVVHHVAKNSDATGGGAARGSSALPAAADGTWVLRRSGPARLKLTTEMRDAEAQRLELGIDWETGLFTTLGDTEPGGADAAQPRPPSGITPAALRDLAILSAHGIDTAAVRARYGCSDTTAVKALKFAVEAGVLAEVGPGNHRRYMPAA